MSRVAQLVPNVDYKKLPLSPVEGNVFSRIDGRASEEDIVRSTGYHRETVQKAIDRLIELGAAMDMERVRAKEASARDAKTVATTALGGFDPNSVPTYEARELDEETDLDLAKKKQILDGYYRLDKLTFYELLGVHQLVDKKQIKAAYYQLAPEYHPDKFFRRNLGSFRPKIEAIFAKLTLAHDTLSSKQRRQEYDEYLAQQPDRVPVVVARPTQPQPTTPPAGAAAQAPASPAPDEAKRQALLAERRRALAAKLGGNRAPAPADSQPNAAAAPVIEPRAAAEALRVRYEVARAASNVSQVRKYVDSGRDALRAKDFTAAVNAFRIAISLAPDDAEVQREAAEVNQVAAVALADTFMRQGEMEANQERWSDAAISFSKACSGKPADARVHDRAAHATFKANNNPRRAVEFARKAVELAPKQPMYRITLAYAYMASGLETSARAELERAIEISGGDERVKAAVAAAREALKVMAHAPKPEERPRVANAPPAAAPVQAQQPVHVQMAPSAQGPGVPHVQVPPGAASPYPQRGGRPGAYSFVDEEGPVSQPPPPSRSPSGVRPQVAPPYPTGQQPSGPPPAPNGPGPSFGPPPLQPGQSGQHPAVQPAQWPSYPPMRPPQHPQGQGTPPPQQQQHPQQGHPQPTFGPSPYPPQQAQTGWPQGQQPPQGYPQQPYTQQQQPYPQQQQPYPQNPAAPPGPSGYPPQPQQSGYPAPNDPRNDPRRGGR